MRAGRKERGGVLAITVVLTMLLTVLGLGFMQLSMAMSGAAETRNATDSGALNVGRQAVTIRVSPQTADENVFLDVADAGQFGLPNINAVWGEAMLAAINVEAMRANGQSTAAAEDHASAMYRAAQSISRRLADQLKDEDNLHPFFEAFAVRNSVKMVGKNASVQSAQGNDWQTSYVNRGVESNIHFADGQLPQGFDVAVLKSVEKKDGTKFIPGYTNLNILGHDFAFVPFEQGGRPQLISGKKFAKNNPGQSDIAEPANGIPNAFSVASNTVNAQSLNQTAMAFVMTHTRQSFQLRKPHGFVRIRLSQPELTWMVNGGQGQQTVNYDFFVPQPKVSGNLSAGAGTIQIQTTAGEEFSQSTLHQAMFVDSTNNAVVAKLLQRLKEVDPSFTKNQLVDLLGSQRLMQGDQEYYIYPGDNNKMVISHRSSLNSSWLNTAAASDGSAKSISQKDSSPSPYFSNIWATSSGTFSGYNDRVLKSDHNWKPGSGYNGCLGELTVKRTTQVNVSGTVIPVV